MIFNKIKIDKKTIILILIYNMLVIQQKYANECYFGKTVPEKITCIVSQWILHDIIFNKISVDEMNILIKEHETLTQNLFNNNKSKYISNCNYNKLNHTNKHITM